MRINNLTLNNYRSYTNKTFNFKPGINILLGENGVGKTNVVEAIDYLSLAKSFRGVEELELIKHGSRQAFIEGNISVGPMIKKVSVIFTEKGRQILVNGKVVRKLSDLVKEVNVVLFEPKDTMLFIGPPKNRRDYLDISLSKLDESYLDEIIKYEKILKERNEILKSLELDKNLLDVNTRMLVEASRPIVEKRLKFVKDINDILIKITRALTHTHEKIEVIYHPYMELNSEFEDNALDLLNKALEGDLKHKATSIGVHREDFSVSLNDKDVSVSGSQGENRIVAIALKLAPYFLVSDKDKKPIVILDDVASELDEEHQNRLLKFLKGFEQVFITATKLIVSGASHYEIKKEN